MPIRIENAEQIRQAILPMLAHVRERLSIPLQQIDKLPASRASEHPLIRALCAAERWVKRPDLATAPIEGYIVEAAGLGLLVEARGADPALPELIAGMVDADQYLHALGVLGVAYALQKELPAIDQLDLVRQDPSRPGRIPDLRVGFDHSHILSIEVKAPRLLHWPRSRLTRNAARGCVRRAISEAASPTRGQLPRDSPGLIALASFGVHDLDVERLKTEASSFMEGYCQNDDLLMGVLFVDFRRRGTLELSPDQPGPPGSLSLDAGVFWSRYSTIAHNPVYRGQFNFELVRRRDPAKVRLDFT